MNLYKAHFVHPFTQVPLIVYFNQSNGHVTFEKDNEILELLLKLQKELAQDKQFLENISEASNICQTQYPVKSFTDVYEFLETLGVTKDDLTFQQLHLH
ncbi:hypothetical protein ACFFHM_12040 [Halalkalibacter kiskunsagensis]|uniref:Uncharacterized protein n=1 Tax=Halalkalibacter kiskunsagensis TaxID=1548599 RepID=A0ABV6KE14_9BACI